MKIVFGDKEIELPCLMGILNVTPDSFSDGGDYVDVEKAVERAEEMVDQGAAIIDVGGESTRPGSYPVSVEEELRRVVPVVERLVGKGLVVSIDTMKPDVARACLQKGAQMLNVVTGLRNPKMLEVAVEFDVPTVIMHMRGEPKTMQDDIQYEDVVEEVKRYLKTQADRAKDAGVSQIILDPGIGFGKTRDHNFELLARLDEIVALGFPVLLGASRKSFIGKEIPPKDRVAGSLVALATGVQKGVAMFRVHDVKESYQALEVSRSILPHRVR